MSDWEPFDDELAGALRRRAGSVGDPLATDAAHRAVLSRATGIRRRRAAIAGGGTLTVLLVAGLAVLTTGGEGDDALAPADTTLPGSSVPQATVTSPSTTDGPYEQETSTSVTNTGSTVVLTVPSPSDTPTTTTVPATDPTQPTVTTDPGSTTTPSTETPASTTVAPSGTPPGDYPYSVTGGSIVVRYDGSTIALLGTPQAAAGYTAEVENDEPDRVRVRFRNDAGDDSRIECRLVDGRLVLV